MRKALLVGALSLLLAGPSIGATIRDNCGCGLGTMAIGDKPPTLLMQFAATFLNGIFCNQTFGMSSGTLECEPHVGIASNVEMQRFVGDHMDQLAMDMARGQGDSLEALADLMAVPVTDREDLFVSLQSNFDRVFPAENVTPTEVLVSIEAVVQS